ncbi:MAG: hypothetical protein H6633_06545 [Anaerolineales bacterium]|nr:hypothetical protein [Anaerolineales bacterium]
MLRFAGLADFYVAPDEQAIRCYPAAGIRLETIRHLLLDQVMPLVLSHQGKLVLHASAVQTPVGAIAFVGQTGRGKSTLAAAFAAQGFPLLTDDCLLLNGSGGQLWGLPAYSGVRLWADSIRVLFEHEPIYTDVTHYSAKKRLPADNNRLPYHTQPVPIHRLYFLIPPEESAQSSEVSVTPLSAREAFMALVSYAFKLDITDHARLKAEFSMFSQFVTLPLFYHLVFPRDFSRLPVVQDAILEDLCLTS